MEVQSERRFRAMGGEVHVIVEGPEHLLEVAVRRVEDLEQKWSRFRPGSEVARLNAGNGRALRVSADTRLLVRRSVLAWCWTGGGFDPTVLDALEAWGYDRSIDRVTGPPDEPTTLPSPGLGDVRFDDPGGTVLLGGVRFDPGGIAKGLAADLVAADLVAAGATAALVNVGGDVRAMGAPDWPGWSVGLEDPRDPSVDLVRVQLRDSGAATSSDRRRRWRAGRGEAHHLIDPRSGRPATGPLAGVSVVAGEAWWAEALTKAILAGGLGIAALPALSASGIGRTRRGRLVATPDLRPDGSGSCT